MSARNSAIHTLEDLLRDPGFASATVSINPKAWSTRRKNIVKQALTNGIAACGYETARIVKLLSQAYGSTMLAMTKWNSSVNVEDVKEEMVEELTAYTAAWIRLSGITSDSYHNWSERRFIERIDRGQPVESFPMPTNLSLKAKSDFISKYLKSQLPSEVEARRSLIDKIDAGEIITVHVEAY